MLRRSLSLCALHGTRALQAPALSRRVAIGGLSTAVAAASAAAAASSCFTACEADALADNPLLNAPALFPRFADIKAEHVQPAMKSRIAEAQTTLDSLEKDIEAMLARGETPTYEHIADAVERLGELVSGPWGAVGHLKMVKDSDALRAAADAIQPEVVAFSSKMSGSVALYKGWCALRDNKAAWAALSPAQRRAAELEILSGELAGVGLVGEQKERFEQIQTELAALSTAFSNALLDATKAYSKVLSEPEQVAGLPASARAMMAASARSRGIKGAGGAEASAEAGPWVATLDGPCLIAVLTHADDAALREAVYRAYITRASEFGMPKVRNDNGPRIRRILQLRKEKAALLGRKSHAEVSLASKMATLEEANALLEDLRAKSIGPARKEHADLEAFAGRPLNLWDVNYYAEKLKEKKYSYDAEGVRQFLPLDGVLSGLFGVVSRLFGVTVVEVKPADVGAQVWDEHVRLFELRRQDGAPTAYVFLDPFARAAEKRGGAWMDEVCARSRCFAPKGSSVRLPVAHMVCNQTPPVTNADGSVTPSLMTFDEVETLFHECGHALQHMLTQVDEGHVSGIRGVEWDAVEQPSQFMENWAYDLRTLRGMAKHWKTGEPIDDATVDKLRSAKNYRAASQMLRQLKFAMGDLALHDASFDPHTASPFACLEAVGERTSILPALPEDRFLCSFGHIFAGGYAAGYFSYKWAEVLSADGFAAFEEAGLENESQIVELGRKYAATVMGLGGSLPAADVFKLFRGRAPTADALLRHCGLAS